jgi:purine nucleosidase
VVPVVRAAVDTGDGPGRGQTICDLRGRYMDYPEQPGARCRVVLELDGDFAPHLVETLLRSLKVRRRPSSPLSRHRPDSAL